MFTRKIAPSSNVDVAKKAYKAAASMLKTSPVDGRASVDGNATTGANERGDTIRLDDADISRRSGWILTIAPVKTSHASWHTACRWVVAPLLRARAHTLLSRLSSTPRQRRSGNKQDPRGQHASRIRY